MKDDGYRLLICFGPGIEPDSRTCLINDGIHRVEKNPDTKGYNGIKYWRCPHCFELHRQAVREKNDN